MNLLLLVFCIATAGLFFAGKRNPRGLCHLLSPVSALITLVLAISRIVVGADARAASGTDLAYLEAKGDHLAAALPKLAEQRKIAGRRVLVLRPEAPKPEAGLSDEIHLLIERIREKLPPGWELISKEALESSAQAVTCGHFDRAVKGERYDLLLSFIGLPQDVDNCSESACFSPGNRDGRLVMVAGGIVDDFERAQELRLFDFALLPSSPSRQKFGGRPMEIGDHSMLEFSPSSIPASEPLATSE
ncbi:MAG: hypothetical protein RL095_1616 [Verrucomicrobiota bacterium]|jgi:hypothetical protein